MQSYLRWLFAIFLSQASLGLKGSAAALEWEDGEGYQSVVIEPSRETAPGFRSLPPENSGVDFANTVPLARHLTNQVMLNGSGVAAGDVDGDGWCDLYFCRSDGPNALFRNLGGWRFENIAAAAGVECEAWTSTGAAFADLDGDADSDLIVNTLGQGTHVFWNDGKGAFRRDPVVLNPGKAGMTLAAADVNGDGYLDLYLANYRVSGLMDIPNARATFKKDADGRMRVATLDGRSTDAPELRDRFQVTAEGRILEMGEEDVLYLNQEGKGWKALSFTGGAFLDAGGNPLTSPPYDWGLAAMFRDVNGDGRPDLYVCSDFETPDRFWIGLGEGRFRAIDALGIRKTCKFSMAVDFADVNRDGLDDFFALDMLSTDLKERKRFIREAVPPEIALNDPSQRPQYGFNTLQLNRGDLVFSEIGHFSNVEATDWSWTCAFLDVDLDGYEDLLIGNGVERGARDLDVIEYLKQQRSRRTLSDREIFELRRMFPKLETRNIALRNRDGLAFEDKGADWGFDLQAISTGLALADLDNDGDLDVVLNNFNAPASLMENQGGRPRIQVRLEGASPNTAAVGAKIRVDAAGMPSQSQEIISGGRYLSCDQPVRAFATPKADSLTDVTIRWPSGIQSRYRGLLSNRIYLFRESQANLHPFEDLDFAAEGKQPLFQPAPVFDAPAGHREDDYDDFKRQPTLPYRLSEAGPALCWHDLNGDGWEDLIIGGSREGRPSVFLNEGGTQFKTWRSGWTQRPLTRDLSGILGLHQGGGGDLLAGFSNYQDGLALGPALQSASFQQNRFQPIQNASEFSIGPLAASDVDGDGDLDLFVGGAVIPGKYPSPASSLLLKHENGTWKVDNHASEIFDSVGLVNGAVFSDVNGDGASDLILACEWGSPRLFLNQEGTFRDATQAWGLAEFKGLWKGIDAGDFNNDGRMDFVAANAGLNTAYRSYGDGSITVYYGDWNEDGIVEMIETCRDPETGEQFPVRPLDDLDDSLPFLRDVFQSNRAYASASIQSVLGEHFESFRSVEAKWFQSSVFLNQGDSFQVIPLPAEAQFSAAFGIGVADFDLDGYLDIALAQNFFPVDRSYPRQDAGLGLILKGEGTGRFVALSQAESGLALFGEQRSMAVCDFNQDGRMDLAVSQNDAAVVLFQNRIPTKGVRVRIAPSAQNRWGAGIRVRLVKDGRSGAMQETRIGSGYWSQQGSALIFQKPKAPYTIDLFIPGRAKISRLVETDFSEILVQENGAIVLRK